MLRTIVCNQFSLIAHNTIKLNLYSNNGSHFLDKFFFIIQYSLSSIRGFPR